MKKFIFMVIALVMAAVNVNAQDDLADLMKQTSTNCEALQKIIDDYPSEDCELVHVDLYGASMITAAKAAVENGELAKEILAGSISASKLKTYQANIKTVGQCLVGAAMMAKDATQDITGLKDEIKAKPLQVLSLGKRMKRATKIVKLSNKILPLLKDESVAQAKYIANKVSSATKKKSK